MAVNMIGIDDLGVKRKGKNDEMVKVYAPDGTCYEHTFRNAKELVNLSGFSWTSPEEDLKKAQERVATAEKAKEDDAPKKAAKKEEKPAADDVLPSPFKKDAQAD